MGSTDAPWTHEERDRTRRLGEILACERTFQTLARDNHVLHPWQQLSSQASGPRRGDLARRPGRMESSRRDRAREEGTCVLLAT